MDDLIGTSGRIMTLRLTAQVYLKQSRWHKFVDIAKNWYDKGSHILKLHMYL